MHISRMAETLFATMGGGLLYVLGDESLPVYQSEGNVDILRFAEPEPNFLRRTVLFSQTLSAVLHRHGQSLRLCHFRDPWSGVPILSYPLRAYRTVYEVNGLPSIELRFRYPHLSAQTIAKIQALEVFCLTRADVIVVPARTLATNLVRLGVPARKIGIVPNGADLQEPTPRPADAPEMYLLYFGALQNWQGFDDALRAFRLLADYTDLALVACVASHPRTARRYQKLAEKLGLTSRVIWKFALSEEELAPWREHAYLSLAPLTACARNLEQGCAPLKILESMAAGVPVVASDVPPTREIIRSRDNGWLVPPERPEELARAIRILLEYPERRMTLGENARETIRTQFQWQYSLTELSRLYATLLTTRPATLVQDIYADSV